MISDYQQWNDMSSFNFDDLFSLPIDSISQNESARYSMMHNNTIKEEMLLLPVNDHEDLQTSLTNNSSQKTHLSNLICGVCGAPAYGYNFDQITCESCKAFFRRNALRDMSHMKCRFAGSCIINIHTRRLCTYCRLKKCFDIKMRKDWIRTEEEKEMREIQKLIKEQKKLNKLTNNQELFINFPLVVRKKKRLMIKPIIQEFVV